MPKQLLYLHGYGESADVASMATRGLKEACEQAGVSLLEPKSAFVKLAKDQLLPIADEQYREQCEKGLMDAYGYYVLTPNDTRSGLSADPAEVKDAVQKLAVEIMDMDGVDGIIGFSQGGEIANLLRAEIGLLPTQHSKRLCFIATYGSEDPWAQRSAPLQNLPRDAKDCTGYYLAHGAVDDDAIRDTPAVATALRNAGAKNVDTSVVGDATHGHYLPQMPADFAPMLEAFTSAMKRRDTPPKPAPSAKFEMPPKPAGWGSVQHNGGKFSGMIPKDEMRQYVARLKDPKDPSDRREAFISLQGCLTNNSLASDLLSIEGSVDVLKAIAESDDRDRGTAISMLGKMKIEPEKYDFSRDDVRARYFASVAAKQVNAAAA